MTRVIALGASNLTRGLQTVLRLSAAQWGPGTEVYAALGLGRSYGQYHRLGFRGLPAILDCGLWPAVAAAPRVDTIGLITDVGNDILYGSPPDQILEWVGEAATRLSRYTSTITITGLPVANAAVIPEWQFRIMRAIMFPSSGQTLARVREHTVIVQAGLQQLAAARGYRFVPVHAEWYGIDPVHFTHGHWRRAWGEFLGVDPRLWTLPPEPMSTLRHARQWLRADEHRWLFGLHQHTPQHGAVRLY